MKPSLSSCTRQHRVISSDVYTDIFSQTAIIYTDVSGIMCVYKCTMYDNSVLLKSAVYNIEEKLCACTARHFTSSTSTRDGVMVHVTPLSRAGMYHVVPSLLFFCHHHDNLYSTSAHIASIFDSNIILLISVAACTYYILRMSITPSLQGVTCH